MPDERQGALSGSSRESRDFLAAVLDPATGALELQKYGLFWDSVATALVERRGTGVTTPRRVAVLDSGFDLGVERLRATTADHAQVPARNATRHGRHGTAVALLINEVAPDAELILIDVQPTIHLYPAAVASGIRYAVEQGADVINLSLEFPTDARPRSFTGVSAQPLLSAEPDRVAFLEQVRLWRRLVEPYEDDGCSDCAICAGVKAAPVEVSFFSASGNTERYACPACCRRVTGVGFHSETITDVGGQVFTRQALASADESNFSWEVSVPEPPGFEGTSFASPLMSGLAALTPSPRTFAAMAGLPTALFPAAMLGETLSRDGNPNVRALQTWQEGLELFAEACPPEHQHWMNRDPHPCGTCAFAMHDWYLATTVAHLVQGHLVEAIERAGIGATCCPHSSRAVGNFGECFWRFAQALPADSAERLDALHRARDAFGRAAELAPPTVKMYAERQALVEAAVTAVIE